MARIKPDPTFKEVSRLAAEKERAGDYGNAKELWQRAYALAKKQSNKAWCKSRVEFLERWGGKLCKA